MRRSGVVVSPEALDDLDDIWIFIAEDSIETADKVEEGFLNAFRLLARQPELGHTRTDLTDQAVKFWSVHSYLVVYSPDQRPIEIVRVLHGALDLTGIL